MFNSFTSIPNVIKTVNSCYFTVVLHFPDYNKTSSTYFHFSIISLLFEKIIFLFCSELLLLHSSAFIYYSHFRQILASLNSTKLVEITKTLSLIFFSSFPPLILNDCLTLYSSNNK